MTAVVTFKMTVGQLDCMRAILKRDGELIAQKRDAAIKAGDTETLKTLQREQYQREEVQRALGI